MKLTPYDVIRRPRLTERSVYQREAQNAYSFEVHPAANKVQIREAVERLFKVQVTKVTTQNRPAKHRRGQHGMIEKRPEKKLALVTLPEGQAIEGV
jgi:large subunit ribosomal protein L23